VTFTTSHLMLDLSALPFHSAELNADFWLGAGNDGKPLLLLSPAAYPAAPSPHERFACTWNCRAMTARPPGNSAS
jgi:hypothetical protein